MTELESKQRTPLFHIVKRKSLPWYQAWAIRAAAIVLALVVCVHLFQYQGVLMAQAVADILSAALALGLLAANRDIIAKQ